MKKVTIKDIAKVANVSYTTVSRALSGSPDIGEETRRRIVKIAGEMGYAPNPAARTPESKSIGLIVSNISSPFTSEIALYVEEQAWAHSYSLILCNSGSNIGKEEAAYRLMLERHVDGIIIHPTYTETYQRIAPYLGRVPTVFMNADLGDLPESYVSIDNYKGSYMGTEYLYTLGHRNIVYFGRRLDKETRQLRYQGYADVCQLYGLKPLCHDCPTDSSSIQQGYVLAKEMFAKFRGFTAVFAATDILALSVLQAADELGIRVPEDLSLLGFDNIAFSALPKINLTTIEQPKQAIAASALNMLLEKIKFPSTQSTHRLLSPSLVIRESCRRIERTQIQSVI